MRIDLSRYLEERYRESISEMPYEGPVITISREYGCPAKKISRALVQKLNERKPSRNKKKMPWRWISKEILEESAKELEVDPSEIRYVFRYEKKTIFDDILRSHAKKYYKSDRQIRRTIARVIRNIGIEGNIVIIGRGGVAITRDIERSLHTNIFAPIEWRALRVSQKRDMEIEEAKKYALDIDQKRKELRDSFHGSDTDYTQFDLSLNAMTLSVDDIASIIVSALEIRGMI